jgi:hypothetical protein
MSFSNPWKFLQDYEKGIESDTEGAIVGSREFDLKNHRY